MSEFIAVAKLEDLPPGGIKYVEVSGKPIVLCHAAGKIYAVGNLCTHDNGPLSGGTLEDHQIECPRHGAKFDVRTGQVICLPAPLPIPSYEVKVEGNRILVKVD